jgi:glycosyltransferase involved in cell wall biosynthesis
MRVGIYDNLANNAYIQARVLSGLDGVDVELILDPFDRYVMSDPRWEELDIELPSDALAGAVLPDCDMPGWIRREPPELAAAREGGYVSRYRADILAAPASWRAWTAAARRAGWRGARMAIERWWVIQTMARYDCVIAYGWGPAWAALAGVPFIAETWGGDITILPFYDLGEWEGHETFPLPEPRAEQYAASRLQRMGYDASGRIVLTDPRFQHYADRLGHADKSVHIGFVVDVDRYAPGPEPELRAEILGGREGLIVFVPSRQDWYWKGSDRLLRAYAAALRDRDDVVLLCTGWGNDLERSTQLIAELGIGDRVRMLPHVLSKGRLRRYYRAADIIADQFTVGSYGAAALEAMSCARPLLISLDRERFSSRFTEFPAVVNVSESEEIAAALSRLVDDPAHRAEVGAKARDWVIANHGPALGRRVVELCETVVSEWPRRG